ncbi:hypothetical protein ACIO8H_33790 [Streptomyces sp. NPDC087226]|uniref:hypothetical protein n=1 Tax=Streptomyces sp. NPDC087226 TaxID=3365771 RepID=UPI0037FA7DA9
MCVTVTDSTEQRTARERLTLLNEADVRIGRTLDVMCTGQELADPVGPRLADLVCVDLVDELLSGEEPQPGSAPPGPCCDGWPTGPGAPEAVPRSTMS